MVSQFDAPEKDAIFNRIAERKDELTNQLLAHPEHTQSILSEVATLKGLVRTVDAQNYDGALSLMEARKDQLKYELLSLADSAAPADPSSIVLPVIPENVDASLVLEELKKKQKTLQDDLTKANDELAKAKKDLEDKKEGVTQATVDAAQTAVKVATIVKKSFD